MGMDASIFLARFWGLLFFIVGLLYLIKKDLIEKIKKQAEDENFLFLSGWLSLLLGAFTIAVHNIWIADWKVIITIIGWMALIKGIALIGFPETSKKSVKLVNNDILVKILLLLTVVLGTFLIWKSYTAV